MPVTVTPEDLAPFATIEADKAEAMITDALAMAEMVAPCILDDEFAHAAAARAVIRGAILRWHEAGTGAAQQLTALGFSQTFDNRQVRRGMFWPSEIEQLQTMCKASTDDRGAWSYDTVPVVSRHTDTCALHFGASCSCGAVLLA